jgi:ribosome-associated protein
MKNVLNALVEILDSKKAMDIRVLDISKVSTFTNYFIICSGANDKHIQTLADELREKLKAGQGLSPAHIEGYSHAQWVLLDYFDFIVHIFSMEAREYYELENLWTDGTDMPVTGVTAGPRKKARPKSKE